MNSGRSLFADGDRIGFQLVRGNALWREALLLQQLSQQSPCRLSASSWQDQEVEHLAFVIYRPPQPVITATDLDNHIIEVPTRTGARTAAAKIARNQSAELQEPASNRFVRNIDATLGQQILDITKRKREPGVEPYRMLDDLGRKTMSFERYRDHTETVPVPPRADYRLNVSMPAEPRAFSSKSLTLWENADSVVGPAGFEPATTPL